MRRAVAAMLAMVMVSAMAVTQVGAGGAPPLTIDPAEGDPGDTITAQVDPALVDAGCITETADAQAAAGAAAVAWQGLIPTDPAGYGAPPIMSYEEAVAFIGAATLGNIAADPASADGLVENTFILSLADLSGQPFVLSSFDPDTGAGEVVVPDDTEPGLYAVAATCVFPAPNAQNFAAAVTAIAAQMETDLGPFDLAAFNGNLLANAGTYGPAILPLIMTPQAGAGPWTATYTVVAPLPPLDPMTEAFCGVLLEFAGIEAVIDEALAAIPADDGSASNEEWAADHDWDDIEATLRAMGETVQSLVDEGDASRVAAVADDWATVTDQVRDLLNALDAVDYDLSTPTGRQVAALLTAEPEEGGEADTEVEDATAALTDFVVGTCLAGTPTATPMATPAATPAPAASPVAAQPQFTG